jgi:uncharacterized protein YebE (UPF0316 family)
VINGEIIALLFVFFARVLDVSMGTFRIILISRGYIRIAPLLGFFEILIWITALGHVLNNLTGVMSYVVYAAGFATGNFAGMKLESVISIGYQSIRIITTEKITALPLILREEGFGLTTVAAKGMKGEVQLIYITAAKSKVKKLLSIVEALEPKAFVTIEDVRAYRSGFILKSEFFQKFGRSTLGRK